jgi:hypothetical protein
MAFDFFVEDESGNLTTNPMLVHTTATTNSSGIFNVDITGAGLTHVYSVHATVVASNSSLSNAVGTSIYTFNTTTITGIAYSPTAAVLGLLGITAVGSGHIVYITIIGDQV